MITIEKNKLNTIYPTFSELKLEVNNPIRLLVKSEFDRSEKEITLTVNLSSSGRYDKYEIVEPTDIQLKRGFYIYKAYEVLINEEERLVETGRLNVI